MLAMPSFLDILVSSVVFLAVLWYAYRFLDEQGIPKGLTRSMLVLTIATVASVVSSAAVSWAENKMTRSSPAAQAPAAAQMPATEGAPQD